MSATISDDRHRTWCGALLNMQTEQVDFEQDLYPGSLHLPLPTKYETVYGWAARYHRLSASSDPTKTSKLLFGHPAAGLIHDFPKGLNHFVKKTGGMLGSINDVLQHRTVFGFHTLLVGSARRSQLGGLVKAGCGGGSLRRTLGLNKLARVAIPLKVCMDCVAKSLSGSAATWNANHQWSTSLVCVEHGRPLHILRDDIFVARRNDFILPRDLDANCWGSLPSLSSKASAVLIEIARWTEGLLVEGARSYRPDLLHYTYHLRAKALGWLAMDGSLRLQALRDAFEGEYRGLAAVPTLDFLSDISGPNAGFLGLLLRKYPGHRHPAKHIFLLRLLFREQQEFSTAYSETESIFASGGADALEARLRDTRDVLAHMVGAEGRSVNSVSNELGIAPGQAIKYLKKVGVTYKRRPRTAAATLSSLEQMLRSGTPRANIVATLNIRGGYIKSFLADKPELRMIWEAALIRHRTSDYRAKFVKVLGDNRGMPIKRIRRIPGNGFSWLYRNDREWLEERLPGLWLDHQE